MERFVKGDIIVLPFPYSDFSQAKKRPALVISTLQGDDIILCQVTTRSVQDDYAIPISNGDFIQGSLKQLSNIRPNRLFTVDKSIILYKIGSISTSKLRKVIDKIIEIIESG
jgi:mRNA interferase MazF